MENIEQKLDTIQDKIDELYKKYGATDEIIDLQIAINKLRHKLDITDKKQQIYETYTQ